MRARSGRAEEASLEILLPSGQPSNPVGQGAGRHTQDSAFGVTVSRAPISEGTGGARKPCDPLGLSAKPEPRASIPPRCHLHPLQRGSVLGQFRAGRGPRQVSSPSRCARGTEPGRPPIPPPCPLTSGRAPPHLTLPRRGSPAEPAAPRPTEQRRAGEGRASLAHAHWSPRASGPASPASPSEQGTNQRTPQAQGVGREQKGPRSRPSSQSRPRTRQHLGQRRAERGRGAPLPRTRIRPARSLAARAQRCAAGTSPGGGGGAAGGGGEAARGTCGRLPSSLRLRVAEWRAAAGPGP